MKRVYLLTGKPGTGKTSLIKQAVAGLEIRADGFYTEEIRSQGVRLGFRLVTLDGQEAVLAHIDIDKRYRVGKYGVDVGAMGKVGVPALRRAVEQDELAVVDEIGKMELLSPDFREAVKELIDSAKPVLGTIMYEPNPFADAVKRDPQVNLLTVNRNNREQVLEELRHWLEESLKRDL